MTSSRHPHTRSAFIALVILLTVAAALAQEEVRSESPALTLGQALHRAATLSPSLVALGHNAEAADALIEQAAMKPNPSLAIGAENFLGTGAVQGIRGIETTVQASQTFERKGKRERRVALAGRDREVVAQEFAVHLVEVRSTTASAYAETLAAQRRLALTSEPLALAREILAAVEARVKAGVASPAESARARAALASAHADYARAHTALARARATLASTWGGNAEDVPALTGILRMPEIVPPEASFSSKLSRHPRIELQRSLIARRHAALELEQAQAAQDVTASGGVRFLSETSDAAFVAGVSIPLPVRNRNQGNIRAARAILAGAEQSMQAVEVELRAALTAVWQELQAAHTAAQNLRRDALPATTEAHAIVRHAYEEGHLPLIDVLDAQRALVAINREIGEAEAAYAAALVRVEALTDPDFPLTTSLFSSP